MLTLDITRENVPRMYEISYTKKENQPVLILKIHKDFVKKYENVMPGVLIGNFQEEHGLGEFSPFGKEYFGFDNALKRGETNGEYVEYEISIPVFKKELSQKCKHCKGTGRDNYFKRECSFCDGTKHEIFYDWKPFYSISASLQVFANMAEIFEEKTSSIKNQLLSFYLICGHGQGHYPIAGSYGIEFCNWLNTANDYHQFDEVIQAMWDVHKHIQNDKTDNYRFDFQAYVDKHAWLILTCPGDACGIHPTDYNWEPGQGREFDCHNMDTPIQQIMLLVGLAILYSMAKKYID